MCVVRVYFIKLWLIARATSELLVAPQQGSGDDNKRELPVKTSIAKSEL